MKYVLLAFLFFSSFKSLAQSLEGDRLALVAVYNAMGGSGWYSERDEPWPLPSQPGASPCGWYGVTCENGRVVGLNLSGEEITGHIPAEIGNLTALRDMDLSASTGLIPRPPLTGKIPAEFANLVNLETLNVVDNMFDSDGIDVLWTLPKLKTLSFSPPGPISESIGNLANLESLTMRYSSITTPPGNIGNLPATIGNLLKLKTLSVSNCGFNGPVPISIGNLTELTTLSLTGIGFSGVVPSEIGNLVKLESLLLSGTGLVGPIPNEIGSLTSLKELDITGIKNGGSIPSEIGNLINLESLNLANNELSGSLPGSINNLTKAWLLNFPGNNLSGRIPDVTNIKINRLKIAGNKFNFDGMEANFSRLSVNIPQQKLAITKNDNTLSVYAGGTLAKNTYRWYRFGELVATKTGDSTFIPAQDGNYYATVTNSIVTTLTLISETYSMTLPVTLVSFEGKSESNQIKLTWKTTSETSNKGFEIERSADARTFEKIGFVDGSGDSKENQFYHFTDLNPLATSYYRLKQLDYDGKFEYSRTIAVQGDYAGVRIYPNPAQTDLVVSGAPGDEPVSVFTQTGKPVIVNTRLSAGKLDVKDLKEGIYTVRIGDVAKKLLIKR